MKSWRAQPCARTISQLRSTILALLCRAMNRLSICLAQPLIAQNTGNIGRQLWGLAGPGPCADRLACVACMVPVLQAEHALLLELASTSLSALDCLGLGVRCVYP